MDRDEIIEIGIDQKERLYLKPSCIKFSYMYREAVEVHWDAEGNFLYSPKPREWSYLDWFLHIISAAGCQSCELFISPNTRWVNIPDELKASILEQAKKNHT